MAKDHASKNLFCLDPAVIKFDLYGSQLTGNAYTAIDIMLVPCGSHFNLFDGSELGAEEDCIWDKKEVESYLSSGLFLKVFHNQGEF